MIMKQKNKNLVYVLLVLIICVTFCTFKFGNIEYFDDIKNDKNEEITKKKKIKKKKTKESFSESPFYNTPVSNGYTPDWWNKGFTNIAYNPLGYSNRSQAFYNQGFYPNMALNPQVIGGGGRRLPTLGGTQGVIPVISAPVDVSEDNIAPVNVFNSSLYSSEQIGVMQQVGVIYKIFGSLNEIYPLYGVKRYRNNDTWDYSTKVGRQGNFVHVKVLTRRINNNELQTNDEIKIDGNSGKFRVTMYDKDFPRYTPYYK